MTKFFWVLMLSLNAGVLSAMNRPAEKRGNVEAQFVSRLRETFGERMGLPADSFDVRAENLFFFPAIAPEALAQAEVLEVMGLGTAGAQRVDGLFTMSVSLRYADRSVREHQVSGLLHVTGPVWVAKDVLNRGRMVDAQSIALIRMPWAQLASGVALTRKEDLVGRSLRKLVGRGTPLLTGFLEAPASVKLGDVVELTVQSGPGVMIRSRAVAKQTGRVGEFIRVEQSDTRKPLQALITGDKSVEVQL